MKPKNKKITTELYYLKGKMSMWCLIGNALTEVWLNVAPFISPHYLNVISSFLVRWWTLELFFLWQQKITLCRFWLLRQIGRGVEPFVLHPFCFVCEFFVEDPGGFTEDDLTTTSPEVLISPPPVNLSNGSLLDYHAESPGGNKFYLPVRMQNGNKNADISHICKEVM